ncbi:bifunctional protein GlmU-like [Haliotis asinina]|uniref:bifunctional protein GlmU-like n=1 Tax=Haliotis asinina TaxID=109174 RepID=UPI0035322357
MQAIGSPLICYPIRLRPKQDIQQAMVDFVKMNGLKAAFVVTCCGSVTKAKLRMADSTTIKELTGHFEIVSLVGTLSGGENGHLHISLSDPEGHVIGGHVVGDLIVYTTAEVVIGECTGAKFKREDDLETGYDELAIYRK